MGNCIRLPTNFKTSNPSVTDWDFVVMCRKLTKNHKSNETKKQQKLYNLWRNAFTPFENFVKYIFLLQITFRGQRERCENLWEVHGSLLCLFFSVITDCFFFFFLLNLFYKWQTKVSTTAIYSPSFIFQLVHSLHFNVITAE